MLFPKLPILQRIENTAWVTTHSDAEAAKEIVSLLGGFQDQCRATARQINDLRHQTASQLDELVEKLKALKAPGLPIKALILSLTEEIGCDIEDLDNSESSLNSPVGEDGLFGILDALDV